MSDKKIFKIHSLHADHGDCFHIEYGLAAKPRRLLVDCGTTGTFERLSKILEAFEDESSKHELLVITHIDADHIGGSLQLLGDEHHKSKFSDVWFNGRKHLDPASELEEFGVHQAELLTSLLNNNKISWNSAFGGKQISLSEDGKPVSIDLPDGAKVTVLSPGWKQLRAMITPWEKAVTEAGLVPGHPIEAPEEVENYESLGGVNIDLLASSEFNEDKASPNGSSIALLLEYDGKSILLAADAHPSVLIDAIKLLNHGDPINVDVFKLPHHGSKKNISKKLLEMVHSKSVLISSSGAYFKHPDQEAIARVIKFSPRGVELVFNCRSEFNEVWDSDALRNEWGYSTRFGYDTQGISIDVLDNSN